MNKGLISVIGFLLFLLGGLSLVLSLIGVNLTYLRWLENLGLLWSFLIKILMIVTGIAMVYVSRMGPDE